MIIIGRVKIDMSGIKKHGTVEWNLGASRLAGRGGLNSSLQFGIVQVVVHDGPAVQIERTEKVRVVKPGARLRTGTA